MRGAGSDTTDDGHETGRRAMSRWIVLTAACCGLAVASGTEARAETGRAEIQGLGEGSTVSGTAVLTEGPDGLLVSIQVIGAPEGPHAVHIHQYGRCGDAGNAAGGHFNPDKISHGFVPSDGLAKAHPGDMGNITIGPDGRGTLNLTLPGVSLSGGKYAVAGRAVVLHEKADDFGQPTGNAGNRIGCGPILYTKVIGE